MPLVGESSASSSNICKQRTEWTSGDAIGHPGSVSGSHLKVKAPGTATSIVKSQCHDSSPMKRMTGHNAVQVNGACWRWPVGSDINTIEMFSVRYRVWPRIGIYNRTTSSLHLAAVDSWILSWEHAWPFNHIWRFHWDKYSWARYSVYKKLSRMHSIMVSNSWWKVLVWDTPLLYLVPIWSD